jgi:hypothetical protein
MVYGEDDLTEKAWKEHDQVGIWYGGWSPKDLKHALEVFGESEISDALKALDKSPGQKAVREIGDWKLTDHPSYFHTAKRFNSINETDWVVVVFDNAIHMGHLSGPIKTTKSHPLNQSRYEELFHYRNVEGKRKFLLAELPGVYRLLAAAGRSNVHEHNSNYTDLLKILAKNTSAKQACDSIRNLCLSDKLELIGPFAWEALSLGYLILEEKYVPDGFMPGRTLATFDIIGRNEKGPILAQCKKDRQEIDRAYIDECKEYRKKAKRIGKTAKCFWFGYGGIEGEECDWIKVVDKKRIIDWYESNNKAKKYIDGFFSGV